MMNELLEKLSLPLIEILQTELRLGNAVKEVSEGWPQQQSVFVLLVRPFLSLYPIESSIKYSELNDRHYWKAEYFDTEHEHILACAFD